MTATASRTAAPSAWKSPAASYYLLAAATSILLLVGLAVVLSSSSIVSIRHEGGNPYALFLIQLAALVVGVVCLVFGSRMSVQWWKRMGPLALYGSVALLVLVPLVGETSGGNRNWIRLGMVTVQPSEIAKLGLALYLGVVLATFRHELTTVRRILIPGGIATLAVLALVLLGRDMGTAIVIALLAAAAFWVAGLPL